MCVVSMVGDHYTDKWKPAPWYPNVAPLPSVDNLTRAELEAIKTNIRSLVADFEALKKEVLEMKELLVRAKEYDERNNEPHCEMESKVDILKKIAAVFDVDLKDVFDK